MTSKTRIAKFNPKRTIVDNDLARYCVLLLLTKLVFIIRRRKAIVLGRDTSTIARIGITSSSVEKPEERD